MSISFSLALRIHPPRFQADAGRNRGFTGIERIWLSPKRAIDGDLVHDALESSQLSLTEPRDKEIGDRAQVDRRRIGKAGHARIGQHDHDTPPVCIGIGSTNQAFVHQPRDAASHARPRDERPGREVGHAQLAAREGQLCEHIEIGQGQSGLLFEIRIELAHERGVRPQQRAPRFQSATARQLLRREPIEDGLDVRLGSYLHPQRYTQLKDIRYLHLQVIPSEQRGRERMATELYTCLDRSIRRRFGTLADDARETQADEIRRLTSAPDVMLGSVHAVTEGGSLLTASFSGSQLGPYVSGAGRLILVVGTQKIVSDLEEGLRRINEYVFPLEDARAQAAYGVHSGVNKVLIINRELVSGRITVVFVDEVLGF